MLASSYDPEVPALAALTNFVYAASIGTRLAASPPKSDWSRAETEVLYGTNRLTGREEKDKWLLPEH